MVCIGAMKYPQMMNQQSDQCYNMYYPKPSKQTKDTDQTPFTTNKCPVLPKPNVLLAADM